MRRNILLVDDDPSMQELVSFLLEQSGFVVKCVPEAYSAIDELHANPYDLIILDISMPHMNGFTLLKSLRADEKFKNFPVIMLTATADKDSLEKFKSCNISDYILKPPQREDLISRVERVLGGRPQFEEIVFPEDDFAAQGFFEVPLKIKSLSRNGMVVTSPVQLEKKYVIKTLSLNILKDLGIHMEKFVVMSCTPKENSSYEYFISFLGMRAADQEKLRQYILAKIFKMKSGAA